MEPEKREDARRLRREEGMAITDICKQLGVSKSSVSVWVRDIELTQDQKEALYRQHYAFRAQIEGGNTNARKFRERRRQYQAEGRQKARERDPLHIAGCMLYWGEGAKNRNCLKMSNSDPDMLRFFTRFLRESLDVDTSRITVRIMCYLNNGVNQEEVENHWAKILSLPKECFRKTTVNQPISSQQRGRKLLYGTCEVAVSETRIVQHVFGAIQEYAGIEKPDWLM